VFANTPNNLSVGGADTGGVAAGIAGEEGVMMSQTITLKVSDHIKSEATLTTENAMAIQSLSIPAVVRQNLELIAQILVRHGARRIILYGSFARGDFHAPSDLDLCVEGLSPMEYLSAWADALMQANHPFSILALEDARGYLRERILSEGRVLYVAN
jgi:predicted nucleotidyltransferase